MSLDGDASLPHIDRAHQDDDDEMAQARCVAVAVALMCCALVPVRAQDGIAWPDDVPLPEEEAAPGWESIKSSYELFTPEVSHQYMPFQVGLTNAYVPSSAAMCSGAIAGFTDTPIQATDCHAQFQFLLERDTRKVRYGCFQCDATFRTDLDTLPYASCDNKPICSTLPLAYYHCFLRNDTKNDMFSCLMSIDSKAVTLV